MENKVSISAPLLFHSRRYIPAFVPTFGRSSRQWKPPTLSWNTPFFVHPFPLFRVVPCRKTPKQVPKHTGEPHPQRRPSLLSVPDRGRLSRSLTGDVLRLVAAREVHNTDPSGTRAAFVAAEPGVWNMYFCLVLRNIETWRTRLHGAV